LVGTLACSGDKEGDTGGETLCSPDAGPGTASAQVDGVAVSWSDVVWTDTGSAVQVTTGTTDELRITLVGNGVSADVLDGNGTTVSLDGTEGFGLLYQGSDSHSSADGSGSMVMLSGEDELVRGCFSFTSDGPVVAEGSFAATRLAR
jgi:hypothetical protein